MEGRAIKVEIAGRFAVCSGGDQGRGGGQVSNMRLVTDERRRRDCSSIEGSTLAKNDPCIEWTVWVE